MSHESLSLLLFWSLKMRAHMYDVFHQQDQLSLACEWMTAAFGADNAILFGSLSGHGGGYCQGSQFAAGMNEPNSATPL